jgi:hypothetical protein
MFSNSKYFFLLMVEEKENCVEFEKRIIMGFVSPLKLFYTHPRDGNIILREHQNDGPMSTVICYAWRVLLLAWDGQGNFRSDSAGGGLVRVNMF